MLTVHDKNFVPFIIQAVLEERIHALSAEISQDYADKKPLLVVVLNGAFMFASELMKYINIPCEITFIRVSSYQSTASSGTVKQILGLKESLQNRHVIIVEDIVDTGLTMVEIMGQITAQKPASVEIAAMLHKPEATKVPVTIKYVGFEIENKFVVGYGLDYNELGRNVHEIYVLAE
ncbi:MAG: hypoxanthine phosphoribosyltransferase [Spirosomataceae bacterium]